MEMMLKVTSYPGQKLEGWCLITGKKWDGRVKTQLQISDVERDGKHQTHQTRKENETEELERPWHAPARSSAWPCGRYRRMARPCGRSAQKRRARETVRLGAIVPGPGAENGFCNFKSDFSTG